MAVEEGRQLDAAEAEWLRNEYREIAANWRFLVGLRFALLAFSATLLGALLAAYQGMFVRSGDVHSAISQQLSGVTRWVIPLFGMIVTSAVICAEERTRILYTSCVGRARQIEQTFIEQLGHFSMLHMSRRPFWIVSHTRAIGSYTEQFLLSGLPYSSWGSCYLEKGSER